MARRKYTPQRTVRKIKEYLDGQEKFDEQVRQVCGDACLRIVKLDRQVILNLIRETKGMEHG